MGKIGSVPRDDRQAVLPGGGGDETIFDRHRAAFSLQFRQQGGPLPGRASIEIQYAEMLDACLEPLKKPRSAVGLRGEAGFRIPVHQVR